jgi:transposase-like protein
MNFRWWRKWEERKRLAQEDAMVLIARYGTRASHRPEPSRLRSRSSPASESSSRHHFIVIDHLPDRAPAPEFIVEQLDPPI